MTAPIGSTPSYSTNAPDDSTSNSIANVAGGKMGKDEFLKLLIAQMSNQDPLNPMDGKDLAAQLAQFSSVEQLLDINSKLDSILSLIHPEQSSASTTTV